MLDVSAASQGNHVLESTQVYCPAGKVWYNEHGQVLSGDPDSPCIDSYSLRQFRGNMSVATWNSNALFWYEPNQARKKRNKAATLAQKHDIVYIQETHGNLNDSKALEDVLQETHRVFTCPHSSASAGGLVTIIRNSFCEHFNHISDPIIIEQGRVMAIAL